MNYNEPIETSEQTTTAGAQGAAERATQAWESTKERAEQALGTGERYVREYPGTSVLSVFGFGFLVGALVGWSIAHQQRDDYATSVGKFLSRWGHKLNLD